MIEFKLGQKIRQKGTDEIASIIALFNDISNKCLYDVATTSGIFRLNADVIRHYYDFKFEE